MDDSYLRTEPRHVELCLLCNKELLPCEAREIHPSGWKNLQTKAKEWSRKQVPVTDDVFRFTEVHAKVDGVINPFGRRHEHYRIDFTTKLKRYSLREEIVCTDDRKKEDAECSSAERDGTCISKRTSRSSADFEKNFEKNVSFALKLEDARTKHTIAVV